MDALLKRTTESEDIVCHGQDKVLRGIDFICSDPPDINHQPGLYSRFCESTVHVVRMGEAIY